MSDAEFDEWRRPRTPRGGSPRIDAEPMAFTGYEFTRGLIIAIVAFVVVVPGGLFLLATLEVLVNRRPDATWGGVGGRFAVAGFAFAIAIVVSALGALGASLIGAPIAWRIGRALRRERRRRIHLAWHALNGLLVGAVAATVAHLIVFAPNVLAYRGPAGFVPLILNKLSLIGILAAIAALCVVLGWWCTMRRALRDDAALVPPPAPGWVP